MKSCPPISVYSQANVNRGLELAANNFCNNESEIVFQEAENKFKIRLSKIFMWYKADFIENVVLNEDTTVNDDKKLLW